MEASFALNEEDVIIIMVVFLFLRLGRLMTTTIIIMLLIETPHTQSVSEEHPVQSKSEYNQLDGSPEWVRECDGPSFSL